MKKKTSSYGHLHCLDRLSILLFQPEKKLCDVTEKSPEITRGDHFMQQASYLKDLQQSFHVKTSDAKGHPEDGRHYNEDQQQGEPHGEGDAEKDAQQAVKGVEEELHLEVGWGANSL